MISVPLSTQDIILSRRPQRREPHAGFLRSNILTEQIPGQPSFARPLLRAVPLSLALLNGTRQTDLFPPDSICYQVHIEIHPESSAEADLQFGFTNNNQDNTDFDPGDIGLFDPDPHQVYQFATGASQTIRFISPPSGNYRRIKVRVTTGAAATLLVASFILLPRLVVEQLLNQNPLLLLR